MKVKCLMSILLLSSVLLSCSHEPLKPVVELQSKMALVSFAVYDDANTLLWNQKKDVRPIICSQMDGMVKYAQMQLSKYFDMIPLTQVLEDKTYLKFSSALDTRYMGYHNSTSGCEVWEREEPNAFFYHTLYFPMIKGTAVRFFSVPDADNDPNDDYVLYGVGDCNIDPEVVKSLCKSLNVQALACVYTKWFYVRDWFSLKPYVTDALVIYTKDGQKMFNGWDYIMGEKKVGGSGPHGMFQGLHVNERTIGGWVDAYEKGIRTLIRRAAGNE